MTPLEIVLSILTIVVPAGAVFATPFFFNWQQNKHKRTNETNDLLNKLIESFQAFVSDSMSKDSFKGKKPSDYLVRRSPLELSDAGKKLAQESGITDFVHQRVEKYAKELNQYKNGIDRLKYCRRIALLELGRSDDSNKIKDYFYNNGLSQLLMQEVFALTLQQEYSKQKAQLSNETS